MKDIITRSTFERVWALAGKMDNAVRRCEEIAKSESAMGYDDSAKEYGEIASELKAVKAWWYELLLHEVGVL